MKKLLHAVLCVSLVVSCLVPVRTAAAAEDAMEAVVWEDFSRSEVGQVMKKTQFQCTEAEGSVTAVKSLGAIGGVNAARLSYDSLRGYNNIAGDQGFTMRYKAPISLKDITDIMLYVKLPISRSDEQGNNWGKSGIAVMMYVGDWIYLQLKDQATVSYLGVNSSEWKTTKSQSIYCDFPSGFEGYIKISLSQFQSEALGDDVHNHAAENMILQLSNCGGQCGDAYINAVYGITKDSDSVMVRLNGDSTARFLTTGATRADIAPESKLMGNAMKAEILQDFSSYPVGYDLKANGMFTVQHKNDVDARLVKSIGGIFPNPSVELSAKTLGGFHDTDPYYDIKYPGETRIDRMKAFLFYIKCAAPHPMKTDSSAVRFNLHTEKDGKETWTLLGNGSVMAMEKGTGVWKTYRSAGDGNGIVYLPVNFEGYVLVDINQMQMNPIADDLADRRLISSTFQFQAVGGECGNGYIDGLYMVTDLEGRSNRLITFNGCDVYSLTTDSYATEKDLLNIGPTVGRTYDSVAVNTVENYPGVRNVTKDSAVLFWDSVEGADSYRVDVYSEQVESGVLSYLCTHSRISEGAEIRLTDLAEGTRYSFTVTALDNMGMEKAVLKRQHFMTKQESTKLTDQQLSTSIAHEREIEKEAGAPWIWIAIGIAACVAAAGVTVTVILTRKRSRRKEK